MRNKVIRSIVLIGASVASIMPFTQACSLGRPWEQSKGSSTSASGTFVRGGGGSMIPVAGEKPTTVTNVGNLLDHVTAMHGLSAPSPAARNTYNANRSRVTETGVADSVTAPMWLAITNVSGRSCDDLLTKEIALADAQRSFFNGVDFTRGPDTLKAQAGTLDGVVRKFARAVWARNEDSAELDLIKTAVQSQFSGTTASNTRNMMKYLCAAMTASLDAHDH